MDTQLHALPTLAVLARTVSGCLHSAFFGLGSGSGLLTRPSSATADLPGPTEGRHLETFGPPEDEGRGRPHRTRNERHEKLMRKMRAEKDKDDKKSMRRHGAKNADYRGGVTCLYDTQLLGACLHASECGGCYRPGAVRGMPDVPIAPPATGPPEGWAAVGFCQPSLFQQGVVRAFA